VSALRAPALLAALAAASCSGSSGSVPAQAPSVPPSSPIAHIVIMIQENRSFNDLFAGFPGATTALQGLCKAGPPWCKVAREVPLKPLALAQGSPAFGGKDICHSHQCFKLECDLDPSKICRNDGFDLIDFGEFQGGEPAKLYPYAYVRHADTKAYWDLAKRYAIADEMFFTETAASFIAHQVLLSGTVALNNRESLTDQPNGMPWGCDAPSGATTPVLFRNGYENYNGPFPCFTQYATIADLLDAQAVSWRFYVDSFDAGPNYDFSGAVWNGFDAIRKVRYGPDWKRNISIPNTNILRDVKSGNLPSLAYVIPSLYDSDHPASGCDGGPRWVTKVVNALGSSPYWSNTAIILLWDDWGGWYDPVAPQQVDYTSLGFRVPMIVISPYAKRAYVSHNHYDFGSVLKFVERNFGLGSLGTTDARANSMDDIFDFAQRPIPFQAAPLPRAGSCDVKVQMDPKTTQTIIERDGGAPD
jgi:phospholipase C